MYSRTIALASSAIARIFTAPSRRMSRIGRTCSVPTDACAYHVPRVPCLREHLRQAIDVLGEMLERHGAVLDERHRLAVALHAHHDVEAGLAHVPQRLLRAGVGHAHDAARQAEIAHQRDEIARACARGSSRVVADELDQQDRLAARR